MGTKADFYVGRGATATWVGSLDSDAYPEGGLVAEVIRARTQEDFIAATRELVRHGFYVHQWPWPWPNSGTTDYAYCFDAGRVWWNDHDPEDGSVDSLRGWVALDDDLYPGAPGGFLFEPVDDFRWPDMRAT